MSNKILKTKDRVSQFAEINYRNKKQFGEDARLAMKRHLEDLKRAEKKKKDFPYCFDPEKAESIIEFANTLRIADGSGKESFTCVGFQEFILGSLFGWVHKETGYRRFTDSYVQLARKQGKSILNAVLGLKCSAFDQYNYGQIYCVATKSDQARIVLKEIQKFIEVDSDLSDLFQIKDYKNLIIALPTNSEIKALGRDTKSIDGFKPYLGIIDEYHAHPNDQLYKLLKDGTRGSKQSLNSVITTAGFNINGACYELYEYCKRVLRGIDKNEQQFVYIAQMDEKDDIWNPKNWIKACPYTGSDQELMKSMENDAKKAKSMQGEELRNFLIKSLNIWVNYSGESYLDLKEWEKCGCKKTLEQFRGKHAICGLDLSSGGDLTSLALEFPYIDERTREKKYYIYSHSFMPYKRLQEHMEMEDNAPYVIWEQQKLLTVTTRAGGVKTDYKAIIEHLRTIITTYQIDLDAIAYDPHNSSTFLADLEEFDCDLIEIAQSARSLNDATLDFRLEVKAGNIEYHIDNKLLTRSMYYAVLSKKNSFGETKIDKTTQKNRIDPCDAVICSHKVAMINEPETIPLDQMIDDYIAMLNRIQGKGG